VRRHSRYAGYGGARVPNRGRRRSSGGAFPPAEDRGGEYWLLSLGWVGQGLSEDLGPQDRGYTSTAGWSVQAGAQGNLLFLQVFL
jgi:hypothetical protein